MPQSNMKRSVVIASKGDAGTKEGPLTIEPQGLLENVFTRVMKMINGVSEDEEEGLSDVEAPSVINKGFFAS